MTETKWHMRNFSCNLHGYHEQTSEPLLCLHQKGIKYNALNEQLIKEGKQSIVLTANKLSEPIMNVYPWREAKNTIYVYKQDDLFSEHVLPDADWDPEEIKRWSLSIDFKPSHKDENDRDMVFDWLPHGTVFTLSSKDKPISFTFRQIIGDNR